MRVVPLQVSIKIMGTIANVGEGDVNLLSLQASVAGEGLGTKMVLYYATMFAEPRATPLVH